MKVGDLVERKYELLRLLGKGGMGEVYEGRHVQLGRRVALKFLHRALASEGDLVLRFLREAKAAATIGSAHIVEVYDIGEGPDGAPFFVMEYLEGEDLGAMLGRERQLTPERAASLMIQTCDGLAAAHDTGIIHRDVKPGNLVLTRREGCDEWIKIVDFGIAKFRSSLAEVNPRLTDTGMSLGTPFYMSPEQAQGLSDIDHRTDIYSMGVILYELLAGQVPYPARSFSQLVYQLATNPPRPLREVRPSLPPELEAVVRKAMARERKERYESAFDLAIALEPFAGPEPPRASRNRPEPARRPASPEADDDPSDVGSAPTCPSGEERPEAFAPTRPARKIEAHPEIEARAEIEAQPEIEASGSPAPGSVVGKRRSWRALVVVCVAALWIATGVVLAVTLVRNWSSDDREAAPAASTGAGNGEEATTDPAPELVTIRLDGVPAGAQVFLDGLPHAGTTLHLQRSSALRRVRVTQEGRAPWEQDVAADRDRTVHVELAPPPEPAATTIKSARPIGPLPRREQDPDGVPEIRTRFPGEPR